MDGPVSGRELVAILVLAMGMATATTFVVAIVGVVLVFFMFAALAVLAMLAVPLFALMPAVFPVPFAARFRRPAVHRGRDADLTLLDCASAHSGASCTTDTGPHDGAFCAADRLAYRRASRATEGSADHCAALA